MFFLICKADWKANRDSTLEKYQNYELSRIIMSRDLHDLERRLDAAQNDGGLLAVSYELIV